MKIKTLFFLSLLVLISSCGSLRNVSKQKEHLFILSGQSNMKSLNPEESFTPKIESEFEKENVIVVKEALGGQPIRRWYKDWKPLKGNEPKAQPDLYDTLMTKVYKA